MAAASRRDRGGGGGARPAGDPVRGRVVPLPPEPPRHGRARAGRCSWPCAAAGAPWLAPADPAKQSLIEKRARPGGKFLLGADEFGRDILSRVIYGSRVALLVGLLSVAIALGLGLVLGCSPGFAGGWIDSLIMRGSSAPGLSLPAAGHRGGVGARPERLNTTIAVGIWGVPTATRLVRGAVLTARETEYVRAARALGATGTRVLVRHVLRNILPTVLVYSTLFMANAILVEAALSFLGLGAQPPTPSWGLMVSSGRDFLLVAPHIATVPGLAIMLAVLGFNLLGDGLRDALDPRLGDSCEHPLPSRERAGVRVACRWRPGDLPLRGGNERHARAGAAPSPFEERAGVRVACRCAEGIRPSPPLSPDAVSGIYRVAHRWRTRESAHLLPPSFTGGEG